MHFSASGNNSISSLGIGCAKWKYSIPDAVFARFSCGIRLFARLSISDQQPDGDNDVTSTPGTSWGKT